MKTINDLSTEQINQIKDSLKTQTPEIYWNYNDILTDTQINQIIEGNSLDVENNILDNNIDNIYLLENETITNTVNTILKENFITDENINEFRDTFINYINIDLNISQLIRNTNNNKANIRIELHSNHYCINSHYFENKTGYTCENSYFGNIIDILNLNPKILKTFMVKNGFNCVGKWRNKPNKNNKELVDYQNFCNELLENSSPACLLTFIGNINILKRYNNTGKFNTITIPQNTKLGLYSSDNGGGSLFELQLLKPLTINIPKFGKTKYDTINIIADYKDNGYTVKNTYGVYNTFFNSEITFTTK